MKHSNEDTMDRNGVKKARRFLSDHLNTFGKRRKAFFSTRDKENPQAAPRGALQKYLNEMRQSLQKDRFIAEARKSIYQRK